MPLEISAYLQEVSEVFVDPGTLFMSLAISENIMRGGATEGDSRNISRDKALGIIQRCISRIIALNMASLIMHIAIECLSKDNSMGGLEGPNILVDLSVFCGSRGRGGPSPPSSLGGHSDLVSL